MIEIDNIKKHAFPEIDFKFKNSGNSVAVLWQFSVYVTATEINRTPDLEFQYKVGDYTYEPHLDHRNSLSITAKNYGWGPANNCSIACTDPVIAELFPEKERCVADDIRSGESLVFRLRPEGIDQTKFRILHSTLREKALREVVKERNNEDGWSEQENERQDTWYLSKAFLEPPDQYPYYKTSMEMDNDNSIAVIPLEAPMVSWSCADVSGRALSGNKAASQYYPEGHLYVCAEGFVLITYTRVCCILQSDAKYCVIIDPDQGPQERVYPISRAIPAAGAERFHIMVGATKSCRLNLKFKFWIDKQRVVESKDFDIEILCKFNARFSYEDGDEITRDTIARDIEGLQKEIQKAKEWEVRHLAERLKWKKKDLADFPFYDPEGSKFTW